MLSRYYDFLPLACISAFSGFRTSGLFTTFGLEMDNIEQYIEALIFASEQSIRTEEILYCLQSAFNQDFSEDEINRCIQNITDKYNDKQFAIEIVKISNGYQFLTKKDYHQVISLLQAQRSKKKLSQAALETLAIIAYKQPVTKPDIEQIRGVNCDYSIQKLLEKELIAIVGKSEALGKPILYGTSSLFMDYFGINSISELPQMKDFTDNTVSIGEQSE
ncbi:segregation and condensation protein B [Mucilaginibacter xinganensis]|uniref:Segregation and condensation protein B n=2 Tax=Mucilaginibacter xinganensis TaxID=1234841 RepID=A0A223NZI4_9SPHI|nr:segregation and condensation protein B [Mucilaginibacter xinganensis]